MAITDAQKATLCRYCGVVSTDTAAVEVLLVCREKAVSWYSAAGVDTSLSEAAPWVMDLAAWFYDNRGRSDAVLPPYIVSSVHQLRGDDSETEA